MPGVGRPAVFGAGSLTLGHLGCVQILSMTGQSHPATSSKFHRQPFGSGWRVVTSLHLADIRFARAAVAIGVRHQRAAGVRRGRHFDEKDSISRRFAAIKKTHS
jgi:hypothetical protein